MRPSLSPAMDPLSPAAARYGRALLTTLSLYVGLLVISLLALRWLPEDALLLRAAFGLLPVLPLFGLVLAFARYIRDADELQRLIELKSLALAAAGVGIGFLVAGFLGSAGVVTLRGELTAILVLPSLFGAYGIAKAIVQRSYGG